MRILALLIFVVGCSPAPKAIHTDEQPRQAYECRPIRPLQRRRRTRRRFTEGSSPTTTSGSVTKPPDVVEYLEAENAYTAAMTKSIEPLAKALYDEMLARIKQDDDTPPYKNATGATTAASKRESSTRSLPKKAGRPRARDRHVRRNEWQKRKVPSTLLRSV